MPPKWSAAFLHDLGHLVFVLDVQLQSQRLAARVFHFPGHGMDGTGQLGVRFVGLGGNDDVGALARAQARAMARPMRGWRR